MANEATLEVVRKELDEITSKVPQAKITFPEVMDLLDHVELLKHIQVWMVHLNQIEECLEGLTQLLAVIHQNTSALKFRKKMLRSTSEISSQSLFERHFIKNNFQMYKEMEAWEAVNKTANYLKDLLRIKHNKVDRNIQLLRTVNKMLSSGVNIDQIANRLMLEGRGAVPIEIAGHNLELESLGVVEYNGEDDEENSEA